MSDPIEITVEDSTPIDVSIEAASDVSVSVESLPDILVEVEQPNADPLSVTIETPPEISVEVPAEITYDVEIEAPPEILVQIMEAGESSGVSGWVTLKDSWTVAPVLIDTIAEGDVYQYAYGSTLYYRLVPSPYDSSEDSFYSTFSSPVLSGLIATRAQPI